MNEFKKSNISVNIEGVDLKISTLSRDGTKETILFLHGFGSTKEDYTDIIRQQDLDEYPFLAYDAPGCGETYCSDLGQVSIQLQLKTALAMLDHFDIERFHLVGHSMGGLTALMLADQCPERVLSFTDIEGNIAPEDCFLSRQIINFPSENPELFFEHFIDRTLHTPAYSSALYSASLKYKVRAQAVPGIFNSMVDLSDNSNLMEKFLNLPCPKMFMYGEQNQSLTYLTAIQSNGVRLAEIPECGHFPMYSNPTCMWRAIEDFLV
ncbi:MAG: alpha/beta hydrolase [Enterobacterales bacterium]|nr:alpha/beta hydrolase [Enterobacterales bacterium]